MQIEEFDPNEEMKAFTEAVEQKRVSLNPGEAFVRTAKIFAPAGVGLILVGFGAITTGSMYTSATQFHGPLADIFYGWQAGNLLAMIGSILIYDAVKRTGYL